MIVFLFISSTSTAMAEYRVYQYVYKNKIEQMGEQTKPQLITSTLSPVTYIAYHGGSNLISLDLMRTWICPGHTGNKKEICANPYSKLIAQEVIQ